MGHPRAERTRGKQLVAPKAKLAAVQRVTMRVGLSARRVGRLIVLGRHTLRYRSRRQDNAALRTRIRELAEQTHRAIGDVTPMECINHPHNPLQTAQASTSLAVVQQTGEGQVGIHALQERTSHHSAGLALSTEPRVTPVSREFAEIA